MAEKNNEKSPKQTTDLEVKKIYPRIPKSLLRARLEAEKAEDQASLEAIGNENLQFINENIEKYPCFCHICNKNFNIQTLTIKIYKYYIYSLLNK